MKLFSTVAVAAALTIYLAGSAISAAPMTDASIRAAHTKNDFQAFTGTLLNGSEAPTEAAFTNLAHLNTPAYIYLLQSELTNRGLYKGQLSGRLTNATVRALQQYCTLFGIEKACGSAPLSESTTALLARALADRVSNPSPAGAKTGTPGVMPTDWSADDVVDGISRHIVSVTDTTIVLHYTGTASQDGNVNIKMAGSTSIATETGWRWEAGVRAVYVNAGNSKAPVALHAAMQNASDGYVGELFHGVALPKGTNPDLYVSGEGVVSNTEAASLFPYIQIPYVEGEKVDVTVSIRNPVLARLD